MIFPSQGFAFILAKDGFFDGYTAHISGAEIVIFDGQVFDG